jgi:dipeptidase
LQIRDLIIPQVKETFEVYLSKPFHMWGAEMGANEHGLVIGNEAVFTKVPIQKKNDGLTGMDLLRLALERCKTKEQALELMTKHLELYGQDACGGYTNQNFYYHNSFLLGDRDGGILLETVDRHWVAKKIKGFYSISNGLTIDGDYDYSSEGLKDFAHSQGLIKPGKDFSFREIFSDWFFTKMSKCKYRREATLKMGNMYSQTEGIGVKESIDILRSHNTARFNPDSSDMGSVCLHATGPLTPNQTTGSMVFEIHESGNPTIWLTGTSAPCLSLFKPFYFGNDFLDETNHSQPTQEFDSSLWWQSEKFHRLALRDYEYAHGLIMKESQESQRHWRRKDREFQAKKTSKKQFREFSEHAWKHHKELLKIWTRDLISRGKSPNPLSLFYNMYWKGQNKEAKLFL